MARLGAVPTSTSAMPPAPAAVSSAPGTPSEPCRTRGTPVAADSGTLGRQTFARICAAGAVDILVRDTAAAPDAVRESGEAGRRVLTV